MGTEREADRAASDTQAAAPGSAAHDSPTTAWAAARGNEQVSGLVARAAAPPPPQLADLPRRGSTLARLSASQPLPLGTFNMDMPKHEDAGAGGASGVQGTIKFKPDPKAPYSTKIGLVQIVKFQDEKGDVNSASMPAASMPFLRTTEDKAKGVEGGFANDVVHQNFDDHGAPDGPPSPKGQFHTPYYEGANLKGEGPKFGFVRSPDPSDIGEAELFDLPGVGDTKGKYLFSFETVAKGDDNLTTYGSLKWSFRVEKGKVQEGPVTATGGASATFDSALEKHRDFYVHEPIAIYFDFGVDTPAAGEDAKLSAVLPYLTRFPEVRVDAQGFTDQRGNAAFNRALGLRRATNALGALASLGIDRTRFNAPTTAGATTSFSQGGNPDQDRDPNRRANRRVVLTFTRPAGAGPGAAPGGGAPGTPAPDAITGA